MQKIVTVSEMKDIEREATQFGLTYEQMMRNAGSNLGEWLKNAHSHNIHKKIIGIIGSGNNGTDTLISLLTLQLSHWETCTYILQCRKNNDLIVDELLHVGGQVIYEENDHGKEGLLKLLHSYSFLLDGALGTGFKLPLRKEIAETLGFIRSNKQQIYVVAVDCPSGVECDSGEVASEVIPANVTYTMGAIKTGLLKFPAASLTGEVIVGRIGDLSKLKSWNKVSRGIITKDDIVGCLPARPHEAHKGTFGTTLIVAGSGNYTGAALLAGEAAYRIGTGLVALAIPEYIYPAVAGHLIEAIYLRLPHKKGWLSEDGLSQLVDAIKKVSSVLIGPGLGTEETTQKLIDDLLPSLPESTVFDADGLTLLSNCPDWYSRISNYTVLTPHPGEMAKLTGLSKDYIQANRIEVAEEFAIKWNKIIVLKGANTVIAKPNGYTAVIPVATAALARAGTGDVLAGLICGLLAQKCEAWQGSYIGAWIHAHSGLRAEAKIGNSASVLARDVLAAIPDVLTSLTNELLNSNSGA